MSSGKIPNDSMAPTTESSAFFTVDGATFARWLLTELAGNGTRWVEQKVVATQPTHVLNLLSNRADIGVDRYLLLSVAGWTALLNNGRLGTDVGLIPSLAARGLKCKAISATAVEERANTYGATILEVFEPDAELPLRCRRTISAANDGGTWRFDQFGLPFPFEETGAYGKRRIRERFTAALLHRYLENLGVPAFTTEALIDYSPLLIVRGESAKSSLN